MSSGKAKVVSVNISEQKGTGKHPVQEIRIDGNGIAGDAHAGAWHRQVSLLSQESIAKFSAGVGRTCTPGEFAENITTQDLPLEEAAPLDRIRVGSVNLEVTQIGKVCHGDDCAIFREVGKCVMPKEGIFCRVIDGGTIRPGDPVIHERRTLKARVITLSDRAAQGVLDDRSGPQLRTSLEDFFRETRWRLATEALVLPDDAERLRAALVEARDQGIDLVFTTGSTGVGPRDIAPETVTSVCERMVPGIMEAIRAKYGANRPPARLSRSVAGLAKRTAVFALPGSERAVKEYMAEILPLLEHMLLMMHGIGH
jgi:molybdenum cofactor synthesis domain-containing protein